jgi:NAD-dependent deacetylase
MLPVCNDYSTLIDDVVARLLDCRSVLWITGAGISADSGLPTYRGIGGLYDVEETEEGMAIEEALSGHTLRSRPEIAWKYMLQIGEAVRGATFNRAHEVIAEMESRFERVWTLTQNVDGLHRAAGSRNVIEIHGNMRHLYCTVCDFRQEVSEVVELEIPPLCPQCGGPIRPDVVLFGEMLPEQAVMTLWRELQAGFEAVFSVGTSSAFPYIEEPVYQAKEEGALTVEINPGWTSVSEVVDIRLPLRAAVALDEIWRRVADS